MKHLLVLLCLSGCTTLATSPDWVGGPMAVTGPKLIEAREAEYERARQQRASEPDVIAARHILVMHDGSKAKPPKLSRTREDAKKKADTCLAELKAGKDFTEVVRRCTDEPGGAARGGDLSSFSREKMVKRFSDAAFKLKVGQVSGVVETAYGFHIIQRTR